MKLYYLSSSAFSDNQMTVLKHLSNQYDVTYAVIIPYTNSNYTKEELKAFCEINGIHFTAFLLKYRFRDPRVIQSYFSIIRTIRKEKPDVIYFANFDQLYLNALLLLLKRSNTIIALHDVESHSKTAFSSLVSVSKNLLIRYFKHFHTYSSIQQQLLQKKNPHKNVYNISLPLIDFGLGRSRERKENITHFLFFGNILYYKGLDVLIKAFINVIKSHPNARLTIAGRCKDWENNYASLVNGIAQITTHIRFIGNHEIPGYFSAADYIVLPYRDTTQSGPLMIAYNYNVPVLVSNAAGFNEFTLEGTTGYSFNLSVQGSLERVLKGCMDTPEQEYTALKKRLAAYTERNFSMQTILSKYNRMFAETLSA